MKTEGHDQNPVRRVLGVSRFGFVKLLVVRPRYRKLIGDTRATMSNKKGAEGRGKKYNQSPRQL